MPYDPKGLNFCVNCLHCSTSSVIAYQTYHCTLPANVIGVNLVTGQNLYRDTCTDIRDGVYPYICDKEGKSYVDRHKHYLSTAVKPLVAASSLKKLSEDDI